jgi:hypothetical protein
MGDFVDGWAGSSSDERRAIIEAAPSDPDIDHAPRWAALVAAGVDYLASTADPPIPTPAWAMSRRFVLDEPWFLLPGSALRMHQLVDTPAAFSVRNIFGGDRILSRV